MNSFESLSDDEVLSMRETIQQYFKYKVKNPYDAEDLTQEVMERVCQKGEDLKLETWQRWVRKVAHNLWNDECKRRQKYAQVFVSVETPEIEMIEYYTSPELEEVENQECKAELYAYLEQLPNAYRIAIVLHYLLYYPYAEIAAKLGIPQNTVKSHARRGLKKLHEMMSREKL